MGAELRAYSNPSAALSSNYSYTLVSAQAIEPARMCRRDGHNALAIEALLMVKTTSDGRMEEEMRLLTNNKATAEYFAYWVTNDCP